MLDAVLTHEVVENADAGGAVVQRIFRNCAPSTHDILKATRDLSRDGQCYI